VFNFNNIYQKRITKLFSLIGGTIQHIEHGFVEICIDVEQFRITEFCII